MEKVLVIFFNTRDLQNDVTRWEIGLYTKDIRNILKNRFGLIEEILKQSEAENIALSTPAMISTHSDISG